MSRKGLFLILGSPSFCEKHELFRCIYQRIQPVTLFPLHIQIIISVRLKRVDTYFQEQDIML